MLRDFLKEVINLVVGKQSEDVVDLIHSKVHVNEFLIAKKLGITINQTRNILYKIADYGLVSSIRKKDKKKGWYTYFWKIEVLKALEFLKADILKRIEQINGQIKSREVKQFYVCPLCHVEFTEENALLHDFTCPECGNILEIRDNQPILKELRKNLIKLNKDLMEVDRELNGEMQIQEKIRIKEIEALKKAKSKKAKKAREGKAAIEFKGNVKKVNKDQKIKKAFKKSKAKLKKVKSKSSKPGKKSRRKK